MTPGPDSGFSSLDYAAHRDFDALLGLERMNNVAVKGRSLRPARRIRRNLVLAFLLATGAFWTVMLKDPPRTIAADPGMQGKAFSPVELMIPTGLTVGNYDAN